MIFNTPAQGSSARKSSNPIKPTNQMKNSGNGLSAEISDNVILRKYF